MFGRCFRRGVLARLDRLIALLERFMTLLERLVLKPVDSFVILDERGIMNINPGQATKLTAIPLAAPVPPAVDGLPTSLPTGDVPQWAVSDASKVTVKPSADGLELDVTVVAEALPGDLVFTITDGVIPTAQGSFTLTILATTPAPVASFAVSASTPV